MANSYKDIIITPNRSSSTDDPKIEFRGANTSTNTNINLKVYPTSNGTLSFEGSAGQLFSVTNDLSGTIFSVNDVSGIPSIEVLDTGTVELAQYSGEVVIGSANTPYTSKLVVSRNYGSSFINTGSHIQIENANTTSGQSTLGFTFGGIHKAGLRADYSGNLLFNSLGNIFYFNQDYGSSSFAFNTASVGSFLNVSGKNVIFPGQIVSTDTWDTTTGGGNIYLNSSTGNRIDWNTNGTAAPATTTRSAGTKLVLYPAVSASSTDYGLGIESSYLWNSVPGSGNGFKWYANTTNIATLTGTGDLTATGNISGNRLISTVATGTAPLTVSSTTLVTNLNSDLLDGLSSGSFLRRDTSTSYSGGVLTITTPAGFSGNNTGQVNTLQVYQATGGADAFMTFHVAGDYAAHFGLDGTTNDLFWGGWSTGAFKYRICHAANLGNFTHYIGTTAIALNRASASQALTGITTIDGAAFGLRQTDGTSLLNPVSSITTSGSRSVDLAPNTYGYGIFSEFKNSSLYSSTGSYSGLITYAPWASTTASTGDSSYQLLFSPTAANSTTAPTLKIRAGIDTTWGSWATIWHSVNDGAGSGLDADLLDGQQGAYYAAASSLSSYLPLSGGTLTGRVVQSTSGFSVATKDIIYTRTDSGFWQTSNSNIINGWPQTTSSWYHLLTSTHDNDSNYYSMQFAGNFFSSNAIYYRATNGDGNTAWNKIWHSGNDGAGSTLDADLLDGQQGSFYQNPTITNDTSTNATRYIIFDDVTSGTLASVGVSSTKLYFNPSTGTLSATIFSSLSDKTLKENIISIETNPIINELNPVEFYWKDSKKKSYGFIAQEVEKILPDIVNENEGVKSIEYQAIIPFLVKQVQEQQKTINLLISEINELKRSYNK
jgi:hypothetical protein